MFLGACLSYSPIPCQWHLLCFLTLSASLNKYSEGQCNNPEKCTSVPKIRKSNRLAQRKKRLPSTREEACSTVKHRMMTEPIPPRLHFSLDLSDVFLDDKDIKEGNGIWKNISPVIRKAVQQLHHQVKRLEDENRTIQCQRQASKPGAVMKEMEQDIVKKLKEKIATDNENFQFVSEQLQRLKKQQESLAQEQTRFLTQLDQKMNRNTFEQILAQKPSAKAVEMIEERIQNQQSHFSAEIDRLRIMKKVALDELASLAEEVIQTRTDLQALSNRVMKVQKDKISEQSFKLRTQAFVNRHELKRLFACVIKKVKEALSLAFTKYKLHTRVKPRNETHASSHQNKPLKRKFTTLEQVASKVKDARDESTSLTLHSREQSLSEIDFSTSLPGSPTDAQASSSFSSMGLLSGDETGQGTKAKQRKQVKTGLPRKSVTMRFNSKPRSHSTMRPGSKKTTALRHR